MSLFIAGLAFPTDSDNLIMVKAGILAAWTISAIAGSLVLLSHKESPGSPPGNSREREERPQAPPTHG